MAVKYSWLLAVLPIAACSADTPPSRLAAAAVTAEAPARLVVRTHDFAFSMPDTVPAGVTTIELINDGPEFHHMEIVRLEQGKTLADIMQVLQSHQPTPAWAVELGGPNSPGAPGESNNATVNLLPGNYVALCFIPSPDGTPHIMKGMVKEFTVVGESAMAALPAADIVMTLDDYSFETSAPITAGRHVIRFENAAAQAHEVLFVKLEPGRTALEFAQFIEQQQGPPPGRVVAGITGLTRGQASQSTIEFEPGEYALLCFFPDAKDGAPHIMHGMVKQITVS